MSKEPFDLDGVRWDDRPPQDDLRFIPIYTAQPLVTLTLTVICEQLVGVRVHYLDQRTTPCRYPLPCDGCAARRGLRWKGYLGCWEPAFSRLCMLEVTHEAARMANVDLFPCKRSLRGSRVKTWRIGVARNAPARIELFDPIQPEDLPEAFNVRAALLRLWNGRDRR